MGCEVVSIGDIVLAIREEYQKYTNTDIFFKIVMALNFVDLKVDDKLC